jgi:uncharacterized tellurite resistance protein B-like protein
MTDSTGKSAGFGERVRAFLESHDSLNRVAHDPVLTAELLLLVRMSFADKSVEAEEADAFAAICTRLLGLHADELKDILKYLNDFGYETTDAQAAAMLAGLDEARKREILDHLAIIAKADGEVDDDLRPRQPQQGRGEAIRPARGRIDRKVPRLAGGIRLSGIRQSGDP